jgi:hypothetical protein
LAKTKARKLVKLENVPPKHRYEGKWCKVVSKRQQKNQRPEIHSLKNWKFSNNLNRDGDI